MNKTGVMICGHGSRDPEACAEFDLLARYVRERLPEMPVESGYLEFARPVIRESLKALKTKGVTRIAAVPGMLFAAGHVKNDLPWEINSFAAENPELSITYGRDLGIDPRMLAAAKARVEEAIGVAGKQIANSDTLLLVVGRGTNDPDANSNVSKVTRMLWEGMGFGWAETAYSGVAYPLVDQALERLVRLGYSRIIVFPYFLFTGILVKRIHTWVDAAARQHSGIQFIKAPYLRDHPLVIDTFLERIKEALEGSPNMNCQLCKYREQVIGHEAAQGQAQAGHHHHVVGIGHGHGHSHDHEHPHPHPHPHVHA
jgi:sirohydrochlorin cobaltochelatase